MMRIVMLAGILVVSAYAANAQDGSDNSEAGRMYARGVCSPCHAADVIAFVLILPDPRPQDAKP